MEGKSLGPYTISRLLGRGGMGEVYLAHDARLRRDVAIKVLPDEFARDPERLARFEQEARLLAALNHPHIEQIYGVEEAEGVRYLVLELIVGETLAERLARGGLPVEEALDLGRQVAEALEAAHDKGIIHRDLKPANIKVTPEGKAKVLDFGLGKEVTAGEAAADASRSPTLTHLGSRDGVILGTAAYMSPEQARGKPVDRRSDVWSIGCVLYEALTGKQAFSGETISDTISAVLRGEPDWRLLPAALPWRAREVLRRCLQKDARRRLQDMGDVRIEIEEALAGPAEGPGPVAAVLPRGGRWVRVVPWSVAAALAVIAAAASWRGLTETDRGASRLVQFELTLSTGVMATGTDASNVAVSPDGRQIVYVARTGATQQLHLRPLADPRAVPIRGTDGATSPFFSPDGRWVGFFTRGEMKKVALDGGAPITIIGTPVSLGGAWGPEDSIIFTVGLSSGLRRVHASGGPPETISTPEPEKGELGHFFPEILPGGKAVLFTSYRDTVDSASTELLSLETGERRTLIPGGTSAKYSPPGHLIYARGGALFAVPFDLGTLTVGGPPVILADEVLSNPSSGAAFYGVSSTSVLTYVTDPGSAQSRVVWIDRQGKEEPIFDAPKVYAFPRLSPDGRRLALTILEGTNLDIWIHDLERGTLSRLTHEPGFQSAPVWTPDGRRVVYLSEKPVFDLVWRPADGSGAEESLLAGPHDKHPRSWSPDGKHLAFVQMSPDTQQDIWILSVGERPEPRLFLSGPGSEDYARFSPDGRFIAFQSNESGRSEIYVVPFPGPGPRVQVSSGGGRNPDWSSDGKELFYAGETGLMAAPVTTMPQLSVGRPKLLFEAALGGFGFDPAPVFSPHPDGRRFATVRHGPGGIRVNVVLNWPELLKKRAAPSAD